MTPGSTPPGRGSLMTPSNSGNALVAYDNNSTLSPTVTINQPGTSLEITLSSIVGTLRQKWRFLLLGCLIGLGVGVTYIAFVPTLYKSSARILIDKSASRYLQANRIADEPVFDDREIGSQI